MQSPEAVTSRIRTGWSTVLARTAAAILLFELVSGLAITLGPFHPANKWGLLLHTIAGVIGTAPLVWYSVRHWDDYADQALSDVLLLGYVGAGALAICLISGLLVTGQALRGIRTSPWLAVRAAPDLNAADVGRHGSPHLYRVVAATQDGGFKKCRGMARCWSGRDSDRNLSCCHSHTGVLGNEIPKPVPKNERLTAA